MCNHPKEWIYLTPDGWDCVGCIYDADKRKEEGGLEKEHIIDRLKKHFAHLIHVNGFEDTSFSRDVYMMLDQIREKYDGK